VKRAMVVLEEKCGSIEGKPELVLHLHDELLYEVLKSSLKSFVAVLRKSMEEAVKLSVPFPVKVKTGPSWGQLAEYKM
jgi:DNA polymerase theta